MNPDFDTFNAAIKRLDAAITTLEHLVNKKPSPVVIPKSHEEVVQIVLMASKDLCKDLAACIKENVNRKDSRVYYEFDPLAGSASFAKFRQTIEEITRNPLDG